MKRILLALLLAPFSLLYGAESRDALLMGIWQYDNPNFPELRGVDEDVHEIAAKLKTLASR